MGLSASRFTREDLEVYEACTCLSGAEILELYDKFVSLGGVKEIDTADEKVIAGKGATARLTAAPKGDMESGSAGGFSGVPVKKQKVCEQAELKNNPFATRLCEIFTSLEKDDKDFGDLKFDEFVDLYNVMSPRASKEVKMQTAFRLYDFDHDGYLKAIDIATLVDLISTDKKGKNLLDTKGETPAKGAGGKDELVGPKKEIVERVMRDCDIDGNLRISYAEFSKIMKRIPDFMAKFQLHIQ